ATVSLASVLERLSQRPEVERDLARLQLASATQLAGLFAAPAAVLEGLTRGAAPQTDDWPATEFALASSAEPVELGGRGVAPSRIDAWCADCRALCGSEAFDGRDGQLAPGPDG